MCDREWFCVCVCVYAFFLRLSSCCFLCPSMLAPQVRALRTSLSLKLNFNASHELFITSCIVIREASLSQVRWWMQPIYINTAPLAVRYDKSTRRKESIEIGNRESCQVRGKTGITGNWSVCVIIENTHRGHLPIRYFVRTFGYNLLAWLLKETLLFDFRVACELWLAS